MSDTDLIGRRGHAGIALVLPFLATAVFGGMVIGDAFAVRGIQLFPPLFPVLLLLASLSEVTTTGSLARRRVEGFAPRLRELILLGLVQFGLILLLFGELGSLARGESVNLSRFGIWVSLIVVGIQWALSFAIDRRLRERERLAAFFLETDPGKLAEAYAAHNYEAGQAMAALRKTRRIAVGLLSFSLVSLLLVSWPFATPPVGPVAVFAVGALAVMLYVIAILSRYIDEQQALSAGRRVSAQDGSGRNGAAAFLITVVLGASLLLAGSRALVPYTIVGALYRWILARRGETQEIEITIRPPDDIDRRFNEFETGEQQAQALAAGGARESRLNEYIGWIALGLAVAGLVAFLIVPLLRRESRDGSPRGFFAAMGERIRSLWFSLREAIKGFLAMVRRGGHAVGRQVQGAIAQINARSSRRRAEASASSGRSTAARRAQSRALKQFMRLVKWGEGKGASFSPAVAPLEFAQRVSRKVPEQTDGVLEAATLFERIVFAPNPDGEEVEKKLQKTVTQIVTSR